VVLRLPAALFGIATVWAVYLLGRELFSVPVGLLASFFTATSFWHIVFSRLALRAIAAPLFLTLGLYLLLVGLRRAFEGRSSTGTMLLAGVVYGLGFHTYIAYRATPVLAGAVLLHGFLRLRREGRTSAFWRACLPFCAATSVVCAPLALYFLQHPGTFGGRSWQVSVAHNPNPVREVILNTWRTARMFFRRGDLNWRHNYAYRAEIFWPVAIFFALGVLVAAGRSWRRDHRFAYMLLLLWMVVAAIPAVLSDDVLPHALRSILLIPPAFLLAAVGAHRAYGFASARVPKRLLALPAIGLLLILAYEPYHTYFDRWAPDPRVAAAMESAEVGLACKINAAPRQTPKVVAVRGSFEMLPIQYLTRSYTREQQESAHIRYVSREGLRTPPGVDFCQAVSAMSGSGTAVFCLE
jgi:4-amino-4-deoxy-L-arabinose transferase-like glycosyltransferase